MKVLFYVNYPLALAPGGHAVQIFETFAALQKLGVDVGWLHNEDNIAPSVDIIHYWGAVSPDLHWQLAKANNTKVVTSVMNQGASSRGVLMQKVRGIMRKMLKKTISHGSYSLLGHEIYRNADAIISLCEAEKNYIVNVFGGNPDIIRIIPNGVSEDFLHASCNIKKKEKLLMVGSIRELKQQVAVARAAVKMKVPVEFIGAPMSLETEYFNKFKAMLDNKYAKYLGPICDRRQMIKMYKEASGLILASEYEAQGLVILEALACKTPVLSTDLLTVRSHFGNAINYCSKAASASFAYELKHFFRSCRNGLTQSFEVASWRDIAKQIHEVYKLVLTS
ncbi:glycosyltransferase family 4 protein [Verrucomicrobiota bacterium]